MRLVLALALTTGGLAMTARSDEGMWLPNDPPRGLLKEKYQFELSDDWLTNAQRASVRFTNGGSGGFVSPEGLIVTNHHIAADSLQKLGSSERDLFRDGFLANSRDEELKCPDLELNVLQSIEDVTDKINAAVKQNMSSADAAAARRAVMAKIEKESLDATGFRSDVVSLYNGGLYHLYRYKKYTDVRLVFAPQQDIAAFGGDVDNFEYPRRSLDVAFFRAYENGEPANTPSYFRWNRQGPIEGDLVFVTGHPGTTNRLETLAKLKHRRDVTLPYTLYRLRTLEAALLQYSERSPENRRQANTDHHRVANARKAFSGQLQGLLDPQIMRQKQESEQKMLADLSGQTDGPKLVKETKSAIEEMAKVQNVLAEFEKDYFLLERGDAFYSDLFPVARHLVRLADELPKPSAERLREYRDSNLESLKFQLFSPAPVYADLERLKLQTALTFLAENLGGEHPIVVKVMADKSPALRADELASGTKLADPAVRKALFEGGKKAIEASDDPLIRLALAVDGEARELRQRYEEEVDEPERQAYAQLAKARFAAYGKSVAPDATFTLRLAFGVVKGYELDGEQIPFQTTFGGAFRKADLMGNREPFVLPKLWVDGKGKLDLETPFNFVSTADTIGGNSGSPVLNRDGELVGINFDRNRHGLVRNFVYTEVQARHVSVHCRSVLEALDKLYGARSLLSELLPNDTD